MLLSFSGIEPRFFNPPSCSLVTVPTDPSVKATQKYVPVCNMNYVRNRKQASLFHNCWCPRSTLQHLQIVSRGLRVGSFRKYWIITHRLIWRPVDLGSLVVINVDRVWGCLSQNLKVNKWNQDISQLAYCVSESHTDGDNFPKGTNPRSGQ
jgi:hypothetical protein